MSWQNLVSAARMGLANGKTNIIAKLEDIVAGAEALDQMTSKALELGTCQNGSQSSVSSDCPKQPDLPALAATHDNVRRSSNPTGHAEIPEAHLLVLSNTERDNLRKVAVAAISATNEVEVTFEDELCDCVPGD